MTIGYLLGVSELLQAGFELGCLIGRGASADVWLAHDARSGRDIAVKILANLGPSAAKDDSDRHFMEEARMLHKLRHPHIIRAHTIGRLADGRPFYTLDYAPLGTLRDYLRLCGPLSLQESFDIVASIGSALALLHRRGMVHRDVKTTNVLMLDDSLWPRPVLSDLGLTRSVDGDFTRGGGTWGFAAPEQLRGDPPAPSADIYSLAMVTIELLVGMNWSCDGGDCLAESIGRVLAASTAEDPLVRPATVDAFVSQIREAWSGVSTSVVLSLSVN